MKDRRHYGIRTKDVVMDVTPEQAGTWLHTRPPAPIMWSRGAANNEKARRYADIMEAGEWKADLDWDLENDRDWEPVIISEDHGYILGGHHRLTAVTMAGRSVALRVWFYSKPRGWDAQLREIREHESLQQGA